MQGAPKLVTVATAFAETRGDLPAVQQNAFTKIQFDGRKRRVLAENVL